MDRPEHDAVPTAFAVFNEIGILSQLSRAIFEARLPEGVTLAHFSLLNHLVRVADGRTPLDLSRAFQVPKTTMTHTLAGAERRGWIALRPHPRDGRSKQVWLTEAGRAFRDEAILRLAPDLAGTVEAFGADRLAGMLPDLTALRTLLDARRDAQANGSDA